MSDITYEHSGLLWTPTMPERMTHQQALDMCAQYNSDRFAGYDDWRAGALLRAGR